MNKKVPQPSSAYPRSRRALVVGEVDPRGQAFYTVPKRQDCDGSTVMKTLFSAFFSLLWAVRLVALDKNKALYSSKLGSQQLSRANLSDVEAPTEENRLRRLREEVFGVPWTGLTLINDTTNRGMKCISHCRVYERQEATLFKGNPLVMAATLSLWPIYQSTI